MAVESSVELIERIAIELDVILTDTFYLFNLVQNSELLQRAMKTEFESEEDRFAMDLTASTELYFISEYKKHIFGLYIMGDNYGIYKSNYLSIRDRDFTFTDWYCQIKETDSLKFYPPSDKSMMIDTGSIIDSRYISFGIPFIDKATGGRLGVILAELQEELFLNTIQSNLGKTGYLVILDENNRVIMGNDLKSLKFWDFSDLPVYEKLSLKDIETFKQVRRTDLQPEPEILNKQNNIVIYTPLSIPKWKIAAVIPYRELMTDRNNAVLLIIAILIGSCFLALFLAWRFSGGIAKPVQDITKLMKQVRNGDLSVHSDIRMDDEVGQLALGFNKMVDNLNELMMKISSEQLKSKSTELRLLQAQINPHFLYNTLDSIRYLVKKNQQDSAIKMLTSLAKFFRFSLSKGKAVVTCGTVSFMYYNDIPIFSIHNFRFIFYIPVNSIISVFSF
jgi:two-component system sensor histidine kinase YesM